VYRVGDKVPMRSPHGDSVNRFNGKCVSSPTPPPPPPRPPRGTQLAVRRNSRNKKRGGGSKSARWRRRAYAPTFAVASHRARCIARCTGLMRMPWDECASVRVYTHARVCVHDSASGRCAVQRAANDFSLRSSRAKCIIYLRSRQARLGARERDVLLAT